MIRRTAPIKRSFTSRYGPARANRLGGVAQRSVCALDHHHPSKLECVWCEALQLLERGKVITDLRFQVRHNLYLAPDRYLDAAIECKIKERMMRGWCSCMGVKNQPAPEGFKKFRGIIPDFEYLENEILHTVDAKGIEQEPQTLAYFIFELIHGRPVELRKRMP